MKALLTRDRISFDITLEAETAQEAALLVDLALNRSKRPLYCLVTSQGTTVELALSFRRRDDYSYLVPHRSELKPHAP